MRTIFAGLVVTVLCLLSPSGQAFGDDFDSFCSVQGLSAAQRQTIVIIDEQHVFPETDQRDGRNDAWRKFLGNLLLPGNQTTLEQNFEPRERVTLLLARKDGAGVRTIFSGCLPFYSAAERKQLAAKSGYMHGINTFFGWDDTSAARRSMDLFRIQLGNSVRGALSPSALSRSSVQNSQLSSSGLVSSLRQGTIVNFAYGIPRIILYSDLQRFFGNLPPSVDGARQYGLQQGLAADLNFRGSEFYVVGLSGGGRGHDALEMFLLASGAELGGASSAFALPSFQPPPKRVSRYQGTIVYPDNKYTVRIRLATDENGTAVNSWLWVQTGNEQHVPIHGVLTCNDRGCDFSGDQVFAQIWNTARGDGRAPVLAASLPFGGARNLSLKFFGTSLKGNIGDPLIRFDGLNGMKLEFSASIQPTARF